MDMFESTLKFDVSANASYLNLTVIVLASGGNMFNDIEQLDMTNKVLMAIVLGIIFVTSIVANISVIAIFYKKPNLLTISNRFIANLTVCNILETALVMPFVFTALVKQKWLFGSFWCQTTGFFLNAIFAASTLTLVVIALDRYCAVVTPLQYSLRITSKRSVSIIALVWSVAILCSVPPLVGWNHYKFQRQKSSCLVVSSSRDIHGRSFTFFLFTLCFVLPLFIIIWSYFVIFKAARHNSEKVRRNSTITTTINDISDLPLHTERRRSSAQILIHRLSTVSSRSNTFLWRREEWKTVVTSFIVLFTFILCWLLYFIVIILESFLDNPDDQLDPVLKTFSVLMAMSSCAINPLVYVFRCKIQRVELKSIIGIRQNRQHLNGANISSCSRRSSINPSFARGSPCITREGSEESDVIDNLHHVNTALTLSSILVIDDNATRM